MSGAALQIVIAVTLKKARLRFPDDTPPAFKAICERCMAHDPAERPPFLEVHSIMLDLLVASADVPAPLPVPKASVVVRELGSSGTEGSCGVHSQVSSAGYSGSGSDAGNASLPPPPTINAKSTPDAVPQSFDGSGLSSPVGKMENADAHGKPPLAGTGPTPGIGNPPGVRNIVHPGDGEDPLFSQAAPFMWDVGGEGITKGASSNKEQDHVASSGLVPTQQSDLLDIAELHTRPNDIFHAAPHQQRMPSRVSVVAGPRLGMPCKDNISASSAVDSGPDQAPASQPAVRALHNGDCHLGDIGAAQAAPAEEGAGQTGRFLPNEHKLQGAAEQQTVKAVNSELLHAHADQQRHGNTAAQDNETNGQTFLASCNGVEGRPSTMQCQPHSQGLRGLGLPGQKVESLQTQHSPEEGPEPAHIVREGPMIVRDPGDVLLAESDACSESEAEEALWYARHKPEEEEGVRLLEEVPLEALGNGNAVPRRRLRSMPSVSEDEVSDHGECFGALPPATQPSAPKGRRPRVRMLQEVPLEVLTAGAPRMPPVGEEALSGSSHSSGRLRFLPEVSLESLGAESLGAKVP